MARTSKNIEYIKDKSGKDYIKANSIVTDDNESLQDFLNKEKIYMVSGTIVRTANNESTIVVHHWNEIVNMFNLQFGFTPDEVVKLGIIYTNGDTNATWTNISGTYMSFANNEYRAVAGFNNNFSGAIRINYTYFYNH